jgi:hypothetical protein
MGGESELECCRKVTTDVYWRHWSELSARENVSSLAQCDAQLILCTEYPES